MLFDKIKKDRMQAMKDKEDKKKNLLGVLIGDCSKDTKEPDDATVLATIRSFLKKNALLQEECEKRGNTVAVAEAQLEAEILNEYLPKQLTEEGLRAAVKYAMADGANNMGAIMKYLKENHEGRYDGKIASAIVKEALNG